jgi:hypothetical protein
MATTTTTNIKLVKPDYSESADVQVLNGNADKIDAAFGETYNDLGIVVNGNKAALSAAIGQFVVLKNSTISGRSDGLYTAAKAIPANTAIDSTYLTAVSGGGLNALNNDIMNKAERTNYTVAGNSSSAISIPSNTRAFIVTSGTAGTQKSMIILSASSGGSVAYTLVCQGNDVSYNDASSNQLIVTNGNNNALAVTVFFMNV